VGLYVARAVRDLPDEAILEQALFKDGIRLKEVHYSQGDLGSNVKWKLDAEEVKLSQDKKTVSFRQFHLLVEPKGRPKVQLKGDKGTYSRQTGLVNMWGNLRVESENGYRAASQHIVFDEKNGLLSTEDPVQISGPFFTLTGKGLFVDLKREIFKIHSDVTTIVARELLSS